MVVYRGIGIPPKFLQEKLMELKHVCPHCGKAFNNEGMKELIHLREDGLRASRLRQEYIRPKTWLEKHDVSFLLTSVFIYSALTGWLTKGGTQIWWIALAVGAAVMSTIAVQMKQTWDRKVLEREKGFEADHPDMANNLRAWEQHNRLTWHGM